MVARNLRLLTGCLAPLLAVSLCAMAQEAPPDMAQQVPAMLKGVGIDQNLNRQLPLDAQFLDEAGKPVRLDDYFHPNRPVILALVYYRCPMLCNLVLDGLFRSLKKVSLEPGKDYDVVALSFDARENSQLAAAKKATYLHNFHVDRGDGLHFLTGTDAQIHRVTDAAGFHFAYDQRQQQFAHASGIMIATPEGRLARYFYGIRYAERDLRLGLVEASSNKIGSPVDEVLLYCFHYDPAKGTYGFVIMNVIRAGAVVTLLSLIAFIVIMLRRDRNRPLPGRMEAEVRRPWRSA